MRTFLCSFVFLLRLGLVHQASLTGGQRGFAFETLKACGCGGFKTLGVLCGGFFFFERVRIELACGHHSFYGRLALF